MFSTVIPTRTFVLLALALALVSSPITSAQSSKSATGGDSTTATCRAQWQRQTDYFDCIDFNGVYNACTSCQVGNESQEASRVSASKCRFLPGVLKNPSKRSAGHKRAVEPSKDSDVQPCDWFQLDADAAGNFNPQGKITCHQTSPAFGAYQCEKLVSAPVCKGCTQPITIAAKKNV